MYNPDLPQVKKLCALAHIELAPEGDPNGGLDVAGVQRDVGAMLRCMQTMRRTGKDGVPSEEYQDEEEEEDGPWGRAAKWATPLQEVCFACVRVFFCVRGL